MEAGDLMVQGICVDPGQSAMLHKGKSYYLFPNGSKHFYVSNFPDQEAHMGCFRALLFKIAPKEEWSPEPEAVPIILDQEKVYRAKLIWRRPGYKGTQLKEYYLKPNKTHAAFYEDINLKECCGCFPLHWFSDFVEVKQEENVHEMAEIVLKSAESDSILDESVPKPINYEQLSLFD